jgi:hypothetical protein
MRADRPWDMMTHSRPRLEWADSALDLAQGSGSRYCPASAAKEAARTV